MISSHASSDPFHSNTHLLPASIVVSSIMSYRIHSLMVEVANTSLLRSQHNAGRLATNLDFEQTKSRLLALDRRQLDGIGYASFRC